jgi:hypothetical protein
MNLFFSDYFNVSVECLDDYGAFNVSLVNDLPVFVDPFLLFNSEKAEYQTLHQSIIRYLTFLRTVSASGPISRGLVQHWFLFPEVKQTWLGYSRVGNGGAGLGMVFANALNGNLSTIFSNFGNEEITKGSHLEKLCLIKDGVGKDNISDFTTNLIKGFLCNYTEAFAKQHIDARRLKSVPVSHASFDYEARRWSSKRYTLPFIDGDFVLLTPKDVLTKDDAWINKHDIIGDFEEIVSSIPNIELRGQINDFLLRQIPDEPTRKELDQAAIRTLLRHPELIDYYIRFKEDHGDEAVDLSRARVRDAETIFIEQISQLANKLRTDSAFYSSKGDTAEEAYRRVVFLKQVIENNDGYRFFYLKGKPIRREQDLQLMFRLTWYGSLDDVNAEVNNGRGPVDYKISRGSADSTLVEFKLASNSKLKQNLENQVQVYEAANQTKKSIKVILYFSDAEYLKVQRIMKDLDLVVGPNLVLVDAQAANKVSASNVR